MNLIFDANYFGYRSLHVAKLYSKSDTYLDSQDDQIEFIKKLKNDFLFEIKKFEKFGRIDKIIFAMDSRNPWRKTLNRTYKKGRANERHSQNKINYEKFFEIYDNFVTFLEKEFGVIKTYIETAEADDLIYFWTKFLNSKNQSNIIITVDKDLYQLINLNENNNFTIVYNNHSSNRYLAIDDKIQKYIDSIKNTTVTLEEYVTESFDDNKYFDEEMLRKITATSDMELKIFDIEELLKEKIFLGDESDEIENVLIKDEGKKNPTKVNRRVLQKLVGDLNDNYADYKFSKLYDNYDIIEHCAQFIANHFKLNKDERKQVENNIFENTRLITLSNELIPKNIGDKFVKHLKELAQKKTNDSIRPEIGKLLESTNAQFIEQILQIELKHNEEGEKIQMYFNM